MMVESCLEFFISELLLVVGQKFELLNTHTCTFLYAKSMPSGLPKERKSETSKSKRSLLSSALQSFRRVGVDKCPPLSNE